TTLFRFLRLPHAADLFAALGGRGILLRYFADRPDVLRAGLPGSEEEWQRLETVLAEWASRRELQSKGSKQ
ncbi:threonine-phosphate decarboxylase, partial [Mesorhizobium sp. M7A.F.Ca.CA.004.11.2.1]